MYFAIYIYIYTHVNSNFLFFEHLRWRYKPMNLHLNTCCYISGAGSLLVGRKPAPGRAIPVLPTQTFSSNVSHADLSQTTDGFWWPRFECNSADSWEVLPHSRQAAASAAYLFMTSCWSICFTSQRSGADPPHVCRKRRDWISTTFLLMSGDKQGVPTALRLSEGRKKKKKKRVQRSLQAKMQVSNILWLTLNYIVGLLLNSTTTGQQQCNSW